MSIAVITIFCNESFRISKWYDYYLEYKDDVALHIIVDNNSSYDQFKQVESTFKESKIIRLDKNKGVTGAYNAGINECFLHPEIDAVAFVGNDIKIEKGGLKGLYNFLMSDKKLGEVSPILLKKDSLIIEDNGDKFRYNLVMDEYDIGKEFGSNIENHRCDGLPGAMNMAKIIMYKEIGLLDETIFMYSDEVDIGLRAKKYGYEFSSFVEVKAWHQHEYMPGNNQRLPYSNYLVMRNKVYLAGKYFSLIRKILVYISLFILSVKTIIMGIIRKNKFMRKCGLWQIKGVNRGLFNKMGHNKYSNPGGV